MSRRLILSSPRYQGGIWSGEHQGDDGYIYRDEEKTDRKWFEKVSSDGYSDGLRVWLPALNDVRRIEKLYWRANNAVQARWQEWLAFVEEFRKQGTAAYLNPDPDNKLRWFLLQYTPYKSGTISEKGCGKKGLPLKMLALI